MLELKLPSSSSWGFKMFKIRAKRRAEEIRCGTSSGGVRSDDVYRGTGTDRGKEQRRRRVFRLAERGRGITQGQVQDGHKPARWQEMIEGKAHHAVNLPCRRRKRESTARLLVEILREGWVSGVKREGSTCGRLSYLPRFGRALNRLFSDFHLLSVLKSHADYLRQALESVPLCPTILTEVFELRSSPFAFPGHPPNNHPGRDVLGDIAEYSRPAIILSHHGDPISAVLSTSDVHAARFLPSGSANVVNSREVSLDSTRKHRNRASSRPSFRPHERNYDPIASWNAPATVGSRNTVRLGFGRCIIGGMLFLLPPRPILPFNSGSGCDGKGTIGTLFNYFFSAFGIAPHKMSTSCDSAGASAAASMVLPSERFGPLSSSLLAVDS
ncbi:hypothetical protein B0H11DRAFT_2351064 [Mycena galericulata]|nr:hypothetical protein B0H11DRAFT_2351064 [Mycena galericulata]